MKLEVLTITLSIYLSKLTIAESEYNSNSSFISLLLGTISPTSDVDRFNRCLNFYSAQLDDTQQQYEKNYAACYVKADWSTEAASDATVRERNYQYTRIRNTCPGANICRPVKTAIDEFNCISMESNEAATGMMVISYNVTQLRMDLEKKHEMIIVDRERCKTEVQHTLHENTNAILEEWALCLTGDISVP